MDESTFAALLTECDRIIGRPPSEISLDRFSALVQDPTLYLYAFNKLVRPDWVKPLWERGFFGSPPPPELDQEKNTIAFPFWPESQLLARVARANSEVVIDVVLGMPSTENISVHVDLLRAALGMTPALAARWARREIDWLNQQQRQIGFFWGKDLGEMISHLARGGESAVALELARSVLRVLPDPGESEKLQKGVLSPYLQPYALFEPFEYELILKKSIPDLATSEGMETLALLCDLLDLAITYSRRPDESEGGEDYSHIWRQSIESAEHHGLSNILVTSVTETAKQLSRANELDVVIIVHALEARRWRVFHRIALYLLSCFPEKSTRLIAEHLTNKSIYGEESMWAEFASLAEKHFASLDHNDQKIYLDWVESGPRITKDEYIARLEGWVGYKPNEEEFDMYAKTWKRDHLVPIQACLRGEWRKTYEQLEREIGKPQQLIPTPYFGSDVVEAKSPKSLSELKVMTMDEVADYLQLMDGGQALDSSSSEALAGILTALVASEAHHFSRSAEKFVKVGMRYLRAVLSGLRQAVENDVLISWGPVLQLCDSLLGDDAWPASNDQNARIDTTKTELRRAMLSLILIGFKLKATEIPIEFRELCWRILRPLTDHPEPTPDYEAKYGGKNMDPAMLSLNTVRGEAMHAVVQYALWVRRAIEHSEDAGVRLSRGFDEMPEVREVLEYHLDISRDTALSIRAIYGQWFPWFLLLDESWASNSVPSIFPRDVHLRDFRDAAWHTYIVFCAPYDNVFRLLSDEYERSIDLIGAPSKWRELYGGPDRRLAEHVMTLYWRGQLQIDDVDGLLNRFFRKADDQLSAYAIGFIGRSLHNTKEDIPQKILDRLTTLWESRLDTVKRATRSPLSRPNELAAFGWWFVSEKFDDGWGMNQLQEVLAITGEVEADHMVVERLAKLAPTMPGETIRCLNYIVKGVKDNWHPVVYQDEARKIITCATVFSSTTGNVEILNLAEDTVSRLMAQGHLSFRDLLLRLD
ncbi:MAG TPA: hypothetical protein VFS76_22575 [Pyrinomonadaceae bacterium]|nr:hypothetical protein [Pyrinomonadaceae bacterium]